MFRRASLLVSLSSIALIVGGCSQRSLLTRAIKPLMRETVASILEDDDPILAESALATNLKLLEGLIRHDPDDPELLVLACQGFSGYSMLFVEDADPIRARELYARGRDYGLRLLGRRDARIAPNGSFEGFLSGLDRLKPNDIDAAYWTAVAWGGWVNLARSNPMAAAQFPRVKELMNWVKVRDSTYYHAGPLWFFGVYYATLPPLLGGSPDKSRASFESAAKATQGQFLWGKLMFAKTYAVQTLDKGLFEHLLNDAIAGSPSAEPSVRLMNRVASIRAAQILKREDDLF